MLSLASLRSHIFSEQKKKQKKRKPTLWGRGCAVKVFGKNTTRGGSAQWAVAVCSFFYWERF